MTLSPLQGKIPKKPDVRIGRNILVTSVSSLANAALTDTVEFRDFAGGLLITPADLATGGKAFDATTVLAFKVATKQDGTFTALYDSSNTLITITPTLAVPHAYPLPDELFGCGWFKIWMQASGSDVTQTAAHTFLLSLKG